MAKARNRLTVGLIWIKKLATMVMTTTIAVEWWMVGVNVVVTTVGVNHPPLFKLISCLEAVGVCKGLPRFQGLVAVSQKAMTWMPWQCW